ncbi:hypothetical protein EV359DRAFT_87022 [Lentinula novae-zelandiae]|nr:hypothetical protein EV359DRAFT_87022 [Lentinula novae-zelandiae]
MSTSRTITETTPAIGSIPITGGTNNQPPALTCPVTPNASDKERELELEMERTRERMRRLKETRKAEEEAKRKAEEEAVRQAAEEERQRQEAAARAVSARRKEEEAAEKRRRIAAAARSHQGPAPGDASTSCRQVEVEIPWMIKKGTGTQSMEARDPNDGDNGSDGEDDDDDKEWTPCERCQSKKIPCLQQEGKRNTVICKPCHDSKIAVWESQMAQLLADNRQLRDGQIRTNTFQRHLLKKINWLIMDAARRGKLPVLQNCQGKGEGWWIVTKKKLREKEIREKEKEKENRRQRRRGRRKGRKEQSSVE